MSDASFPIRQGQVALGGCLHLWASVRTRLGLGGKFRSLVFAVLAGLGMSTVFAQQLPAPLIALDFEQLSQGTLPTGSVIKTQFRRPDTVPGVIGSAWRTDGFSSFLEAPLSLDRQGGFTLSLWVALESYPSDLEVPVNQLAPSSIAQQAAADAGFDLHIDTFGRWGFRIATTSGILRVAAPSRFPLQRWVHLVATVDCAKGVVNLYQDGTRVGSTVGAPAMALKLAQVPLRLATPAVETRILDFTINRLSAAYDMVAVYPEALSEAQLASVPGLALSKVPDASASLVVPESRFSGDAMRPQVHPLPPANWTNEPHGLVLVNGVWHMFYQRTPNGPFKTQMHWGHMSSRDLVTWEHLPDALWPELQSEAFGFDMKGIWSGHVIVDGGKAFAFYTSVNHGDRLAASNPGISMAVSEDAELKDWRKSGPIINTRDVRDFRDPFLWKDGNTWHMLIGAALETGGGLEYFILKSAEKGARWQRQRRFSELSYRAMDPGSEIWEMPVFERLSDGVSILVVNPVGGSISKYGDAATRAVYWTGTWSDGVFKPFSHTPKNLDLVPGHLAPTVSRAQDGQLRAIGIIDERRTPAAQQRAGWANTFSLPRVWRLMPDQRTLGQAPAPELIALRGEQSVALKDLPLNRQQVELAVDMKSYELLVEMDRAKAAPLILDVMASGDGREFTRLVFDQARGRVTVDKTHSTLAADSEGPQKLLGEYDSAAFGEMRSIRVIVDGSTIEVFVNDAAAYAVRSYPSLPGSTRVRLATSGTDSEPVSVKLWPLRRPTG